MIEIDLIIIFKSIDHSLSIECFFEHFLLPKPKLPDKTVLKLFASQILYCREYISGSQVTVLTFSILAVS